MTEMIVDLTNYKDSVGSRVPEGTYRVVVDDAEQTTAKSGNPMVNLWLRIVGGDQDGQTLVDRLVLTERSLFRVVAFLQALGIPTPKKRLAISLNKIKGRTLQVAVSDGEPYNGSIRSEVNAYMRDTQADEAGAADLEDEERDAEGKADAATEAESETINLDEIDL